MEYYVLRFPNSRTRAVTLSYDDGVEQDLKLVEILNKYGIRCTFNLNSSTIAPEDKVFGEGGLHRRMSASEIREVYGDGLHELAVHTMTHPHLEKAPLPLATSEIIGDRAKLEELFGTIIRGMAYPFGTYNESVITAARACGISYARTVTANKNFSIPENFLCWGTTCHHTSPDFNMLIDKFLAPHKTGDNAWLFYLWGHSYEFERADNWDLIEDFCVRVGGREDTWYATNIEICDYITAYRSLITSIDGKKIFNPSALTVYIYANGKDYAIAPGETICI